MRNQINIITFGAALTMIVAAQPALANLTLTSTPQAPAGITFLNVGSPVGAGTFHGGNYTVTANTASNQGFVQGSLGGQYAAPITGINQGNAMTFTGVYLSTGLTDPNNGFGSVAYSFSAPIKSFGLLWGSIDPSNSLSFLFNGAIVGQVMGVDVTNNADGFQGYGGSRYVEIDSTVAFNQVVMTSGQVSFEGAEFEAGTLTPEPGTYGMLIAGSLILAAVGYSRRKSQRVELDSK